MCGLASDPDGGDIPSLRLFLLVFVLVGLATGLQRQWLVVDWGRMIDDLGLAVSEGDQPVDFNQLILGD